MEYPSQCGPLEDEKEIMRQALIFILLLLTLTLAAPGQTERRDVPQRQSRINLNSTEIAGREELVKSVPYSGTAIVESTQVLADGNRIVHTKQELVARDSDGRTRHEEVFDRIGSLEMNEAKTIFISDPVLKKEYSLNPQDKTYKVEPLIDIDALLNSPQPRTERENASKTGAEGTAAERRAARRGETQRQDLGEKIVEGFNAKGEKLTATLPAGSVGNERPLEMSLETWYSPSLHVFLYRKRVDPRFGEILYRLTDIKPAEPDPSLFRVPRGYKLRANRTG
jgi:hypothetical protein